MESGYRSLIENLPAVTFIAALDDSVQDLYVSPQIEAMLGFTQEEWRDDPFLWYRQLHPDDREAWMEAFAKTCSEGAHFDADYRLLARDGRVVWVHGECQLIRDAQGVPIFIQGIATDITARKAAEAAAAEARRAAEAASRVKSEFLAHMSHEIRTPLNGLLGMIDLALATGLNPQQQQYLDVAKLAGDALAVLVGDVLDFSKIESGKLDMENVRFDLHGAIAQVRQIQAVRASQKGLQLVVRIEPGVPAQVKGDPARIRQVLVNLTNNAIKFTAKGTVHLVVAIDQEREDSVTVKFSVVDTGIGIPADGMDRLFKSFSQVDASTTRQYGGTGLGLAISKRLAELMGGQIGVKSTPGQGSTFWFTAKLSREQIVSGTNCVPHGEPRSFVNPASPPQKQPGTARILLAEDNSVNQTVVAHMLANLGHTCDIASDGKQAVEALLGKSYDLVLMDCQMPVMGGLEATRQIRKNEAAGLWRPVRRVPIVALTANATPEDRHACLAAGMDEFCTKPINSKRLAEVLASMLPEAVDVLNTQSPSDPAGCPQSPPPFDVQVLVELCAGDLAVVARTLDEFEHQIAASIGRIERSLDEANAPDIARVAHDLKGIAGFFVAADMALTARQLEMYAKANDLTAAAESVQQLRQDVEQCLQYLPTARARHAIAA